MITLEERATELYEVVRTCTMCALAETRTHAVPGEGPLTAEVMCIGEAPGMNEDKQGRPFVGAAGQFLSELLQAANLTREQVYICNVLKCRPPANRDPLPNEIEACGEYLDLQLDLVDPLVIVTLGRFSMAKWFPQQAISRIHGSVKEVDGRFIVPMYHPAAALHQGSLRQVLLDDFARLPAILERARAHRRGGNPRLAPPTPPLAATDPPSVPGPLQRRDSPLVAGEGERRLSPGPQVRDRKAQLEPPWDDGFTGDFEEVDFDPGDHLPVVRSEAAASPVAIPARHEDLDQEAQAPREHQPEHGTTTELSATHPPAPAAKSEQLSLFD